MLGLVSVGLFVLERGLGDGTAGADVDTEELALQLPDLDLAADGVATRQRLFLLPVPELGAEVPVVDPLCEDPSLELMDDVLDEGDASVPFWREPVLRTGLLSRSVR